MQIRYKTLNFQEFVVSFTTQAEIRLLSLVSPRVRCLCRLATTKGFQLHFRVEQNYCRVKNGFRSQLKREVEFLFWLGFGEKRFQRGEARSEHSYGH